MIEIKINDDAVQAALNRLARRVEDMSQPLHQVGEALSEGTKQRFAAGSDWDGRAWAPNTQATIERYLGKFSGSRTKKGSVSKRGSKRLGGKKPLTGESRALRLTINYSASKDRMTIGSPMRYAATQQFGALRGAFGRTRYGVPIPWGTIPARPFLPVNRDGSMPQAAARIVVDIIENWIVER